MSENTNTTPQQPGPNTPAATPASDKKKVILISAGILVAVIIAAIVGFGMLKNANQETAESPTATANSSASADADRFANVSATPMDPAAVVNENSIRLDKPENPKNQIVEFFDFACEACAQWYPIFEQYREEKGESTEFVVRYLATHGQTSVNAFKTAEAADRQGKFEDMFKLLFERQSQWSADEQSQEETLRGYAEELGLNMEQYDADVADPSIEDRIKKDAEDAKALEFNSTPSIVINKSLFDMREAGLRSADDALAFLNYQTK